MKPRIKMLLACGASAIALSHPAFAAAQSEPVSWPASASNLVMVAAADENTSPSGHVVTQVDSSQVGGRSQPATEQIVVTGSRIANTAAQAPTPVTSLSDEQLAQLSAQSIPAGLAKLPVFAPVRGSDSASDGGYQATGNYLDIYGLGPIRTLVLMDGHRVTSTYFDGTVDINTLPQMLIQRVEVVTGGASAVYGSDAVSGVANFILDKHFEGLKGVAQAGISTWGDAKSMRFGLAGGEQISNRLHFEWSAEYFTRDIIPADPRPYGLAQSSLVGSGTAAAPLQSVTNTTLPTAPFGGLVTNGPFANMQFAPDGTLKAFNPGTPTTTNGVNVGGDGGYKRPSFVLPSLQTAQLFGRFDYNLNDNISAYVQAGYSHTRTWSHEQNLVSTAGSNAITIYSGNPYLKPAYQTQLTNTNTASFNLARYNEDFGGLLNLTDRTSNGIHHGRHAGHGVPATSIGKPITPMARAGWSRLPATTSTPSACMPRSMR